MSRRRRLNRRPLSAVPRRSLRLEPLEDRRLLAVDLQFLGDFNLQPASGLTFESFPSGAASAFGNNLTAMGNTLFYTATDFDHGTELWKSDGTAEGTVLVKDISPGSNSSLPRHLVNVSGTLFFQAGNTLWKSDGTDAGTVAVKQLGLPEGGPFNPHYLTNVAGTVFFIAQGTTANHGWELWKSDGTAAGTMEVNDIVPGPGSAFADTSLGIYTGARPRLMAVGATLYFVATGTSSLQVGRELWKSDGTAAGTVMVKDIRPGLFGAFDVPNDSRPMANVNGTLYFAANDGATGVELWKSDGTDAGTVLVKDGTPGPGSLLGSLAGRQFVNIGDTLYFVAGDRLWKSDGTSAGTLAVTAMDGPDLDGGEMSVVGETIYFTARPSFSSGPFSGYELWKSDGTAAGTSQVKDIAAGPNSSFPQVLTNVDGTLYFSARTSGAGTELWKSDGTAAGTVLVKDILTGSASTAPSSLTAVGEQLFFAANDGVSGIELWRSDGSAASTVMVKDVRTGTAGFSPTDFVELGGVLLFTGMTGTHGRELWRTDGTLAGTALVRDVRAGVAGSLPLYLTRVGGYVYFSAGDGGSDEIWRTDGTTPGTVRVTDAFSENASFRYLTNVNGVLYFRANGPEGIELWRLDATASSGAVRVKDIYAGERSSDPEQLTNVDGTLFFVADDGVNGAELWKSDGTEAGTVMLKNIDGNSFSSVGDDLINVGGVLYFTADDDVHGRELWTSDGTPEGTVLAADIYAGSPWGSPAYLTNVDGTLYFRASDGSSGSELFKLQPGAGAPMLVKDIWLGSGSSAPRNLVNVGGTLYFTAYDAATGEELWKSDGAAAGTVLVKDIAPGIDSARNLSTLTNVAGTPYFSVDDGVHGRELWSSDGTAAGTQLVEDVTGDGASGLPSRMVALGSRLILQASSREHGAELWSGTLTPAVSGDYDIDGDVDGNDFLTWQRNLGQSTLPAGSGADGDGSGAVGGGDLGVWSSQFSEPVVIDAAAVASHPSLALPIKGREPEETSTLDAVDAVFGAGDFTSLFAPESQPPRSRGWRPRRQ